VNLQITSDVFLHLSRKDVSELWFSVPPSLSITTNINIPADSLTSCFNSLTFAYIRGLIHALTLSSRYRVAMCAISRCWVEGGGGGGGSGSR
jgi:hypothetical protein